MPEHTRVENSVELDALPIGTVLREAPKPEVAEDEHVVMQKLQNLTGPDWYMTGTGHPATSTMISRAFPYLLIWHPDWSRQ